MPKLKSQCTPEEWAAIRERAKASNAKQRAKPERQAYMREYMATYMKTDSYRERDNARYGEQRREAQLARFRQRKYGVTEKQTIDLLWLQGNCCAVCRRPFNEKTRPCLDHCHQSGKHRGLLCRMCNTFEGFLRRLGLTPEEFAERLQAYLANPPADQEVLW